MYRDLSEIRPFYQSSLGRLTAQILGKTLFDFCAGEKPRDIKSCDTMVGIGYALPFFDQWVAQNLCDASPEHIAVMGAKQGVVRWPLHGAARIVLTEDHLLPFADETVESILMVHAIENADYLRELMDEVWRVLKPNGRVIMMVPNRSGLWAKNDQTPFGHGRSFSMKQIRSSLYDAQFIIERDRRALYFLPSRNRVLLWAAPILEKLGNIMVPRLGGVTLIEASKRLYNVTPLRVGDAKLKIKTVKPDWVTEPVPT